MSSWMTEKAVEFAIHAGLITRVEHCFYWKENILCFGISPMNERVAYIIKPYYGRDVWLYRRLEL